MPASKARWWLTRDSQQIVISTSPGRVYGLVSDLPRMGEWSPECERVEWADGTTVAAAGARFVGHNRGGPFRLMRWSRRGRVLAADPGREFAFVTEEGGRESTLWRYRFEPVKGGTRVTESYQVRWIPAWAAKPGDLAFYGTGHVELVVRGGTFGALDYGALIGTHRANPWFYPTMYYTLR